MIAGFGGLLGVLFTIPLRRALIIERPLQFPEGVATAEVLKVGERGGNLSLGQRQLVCIARAVLADPRRRIIHTALNELTVQGVVPAVFDGCSALSSLSAVGGLPDCNVIA